MKSGLFDDFDNVFLKLRQLQPDAAERFARGTTTRHSHLEQDQRGFRP